MGAGREGPCGHCGIMNTPLWRVGPREKPVLCNACGSRWRLKGNLKGYVPKHAIMVDSQGSDDDLSSTSLKEGKFGILSSTGSSVPSPEKTRPARQTKETAQRLPWDPTKVTRRKRSSLQQQESPWIDTFHRQLLHIQQELEDENTSDNEEEEEEDDDDDMLIYNKWECISDGEIGFGVMMFKSTSP